MQWAVARWTRQMKTAYINLPEDEKDSDRIEADRMIRIMQAYIRIAGQSG